MCVFDVLVLYTFEAITPSPSIYSLRMYGVRDGVDDDDDDDGGNVDETLKGTRNTYTSAVVTRYTQFSMRHTSLRCRRRRLQQPPKSVHHTLQVVGGAHNL